MGEEDLPMSWNDTCPINERLIFVPPQENLWVNFGSGRAPSV